MSNFIISCKECKWTRTSNGRSDELDDLKEVVSGCKKCGKPREFICPNCKNKVKMFRVKK
jgi:hypothetical protein